MPIVYLALPTLCSLHRPNNVSWEDVLVQCAISVLGGQGRPGRCTVLAVSSPLLSFPARCCWSARGRHNRQAGLSLVPGILSSWGCTLFTPNRESGLSWILDTSLHDADWDTRQLGNTYVHIYTSLGDIGRYSAHLEIDIIFGSTFQVNNIL